MEIIFFFNLKLTQNFTINLFHLKLVKVNVLKFKWEVVE